jgi:hypothetical protein
VGGQAGIASGRSGERHHPAVTALTTVRVSVILTLLLVNALVPSSALAQGRAVAVSAGPDGAAQLTLGDGRRITIPRERGQVGIGDARIASDGTAGWLAEFSVEGVSYPIARVLVIWRAGKPLRRFATAQSFYSWTFYARNTQVAYHDGPLHGELKSNCELHDIASGRTIAVWTGDLASGHGRPAWTDGLTR